MIQTQSLQMRQQYKLIAGMEQANALEMTEEEFARITLEVERSPLFRKLQRIEGVIRYRRQPNTDISPRFCQLNEEIASGSGTLDVEAMLTDKEDLVRRIQEIGVERFKRYFLYPEPGVSTEEIARACDLTLPEVERIDGLIDEVSVMSEFYNPSGLGPEYGMRYSRVASIERTTEGFVIGYLSPSYARGRYAIDYERFEELRQIDSITEDEAKESRGLFRKLELLNLRKDTLTRILQNIVGKQGPYFESGDVRALLPFSQKELAERMGVVPSSICRSVEGKSLETPWGEEKALKDFFPRPRQFRKQLVRQLLESGEEFPSDEAIRARLEREFGVFISRRSVAGLRKELRIGAASKRKKAAMESSNR